MSTPTSTDPIKALSPLCHPWSVFHVGSRTVFSLCCALLCAGCSALVDGETHAAAIALDDNPTAADSIGLDGQAGHPGGDGDGDEMLPSGSGGAMLTGDGDGVPECQLGKEDCPCAGQVCFSGLDCGPGPTQNCNQAGACAGTQPICSAGEWICDYGGVPSYQATETRCDGQDNDCDGQFDEAFVYLGTKCTVDGCDQFKGKDAITVCAADGRGTECNAACGGPDECPDDDNKYEPGMCGCGIPEGDTDGDGTCDAVDGCPLARFKTEPGVCGCDFGDESSDGSGVPWCLDGCPDDPDKTEPGACGCGTPETDSDGDTIPDCVDDCYNGTQDCPCDSQGGCYIDQLSCEAGTCKALPVCYDPPGDYQYDPNSICRVTNGVWPSFSRIPATAEYPVAILLDEGRYTVDQGANSCWRFRWADGTCQIVRNSTGSRIDYDVTNGSVSTPSWLLLDGDTYNSGPCIACP